MKREHSKVKEIVEILLVESEEIKLTRLKKTRKFDKHAILLFNYWWVVSLPMSKGVGDWRVQPKCKLQLKLKLFIIVTWKSLVINHLYHYGQFLLLVFVAMWWKLGIGFCKLFSGFAIGFCNLFSGFAICTCASFTHDCHGLFLFFIMRRNVHYVVILTNLRFKSDPSMALICMQHCSWVTDLKKIH